MTESRSGRRTILQVLLKVVTALFSVALIVLIGALLVLAQPKREDTEKAEPQPLLTASPAMNITVETDLRSLVESFPVPVLSFMSGSGMSFVSGTSSDAGLEGGFGRIVSLYWQTQDGDPLILQSIGKRLSFQRRGGSDALRHGFRPDGKCRYRPRTRGHRYRPVCADGSEVRRLKNIFPEPLPAALFRQAFRQLNQRPPGSCVIRRSVHNSADAPGSTVPQRCRFRPGSQAFLRSPRNWSGSLPCPRES